MKLWEYESGRKLQSWDLEELEETPSSETDKQKVTTACFTPQHFKNNTSRYSMAVAYTNDISSSATMRLTHLAFTEISQKLDLISKNVVQIPMVPRG